MNITGVSTWAQLETQMTNNYSGEVVYTDIDEIVDHWQWGAATHYEHQLTGLTNGIYRITVNALQRASQWDWIWNLDNTYGVRAVCYIFGNDQKTQIISNTEDGASYSDTGGMFEHNGLYYPNNTPSAERAFTADMYKNTLYVRVTDGTLNIGLNDPSYIYNNNQWICYKNLKVERMISGLMELQADVEDGAYIGTPIENLTISPKGTASSIYSVTNGTNVTLYKDDVQLNQITPTRDGVNLIVALPTLEPGHTYKVTLEEKKVRYNAYNGPQNAAFEWTFKTPLIYDGTYYLHNVKTNDFIERLVNDANTTFSGVPITWTNTATGGTIKFVDAENANTYIGGRWYSFSNESEGNSIKWEPIPSNGAYKLKRSQAIDATWEYLYVDKENDQMRVASNGKNKNDNGGEGNFDDWDYGLWHFVSETDYPNYFSTLNETANSSPLASDGALKVILNRTMTSGTWNTICLPFDMDEGQIEDCFGEGTQIMALTGLRDDGDGKFTLVFEDIDVIDANTPYIIKATQDGNQYKLRGIEVIPSENLTQECYGVNFIGNYIYPKVLDNADGQDYYIKSNKFYSSPGGTKLKGFRAYFKVTDSNIKALGFMEDDATGLMEITDATIEPVDIYSVSGILVRRQATNFDGIPNGLYIMNGKKVIIRK